MRITDIHISNYKAFYGDHHISLDKDGKNLMLYGENGSGKSSLYIALWKFFLSSIQEVDVEENIFLPDSKKGTATVTIETKESADSSVSNKFVLKSDGKLKEEEALIAIKDANKIKGFFDYRKLLNTHVGYEEKVDLFDILVKDILSHAVNRFTKKEIGKEWEAIIYDSHELRQGHHVKARVADYIEKFNNGLTELLSSIESDTNKFMQYFNSSVEIKFDFKGVKYKGRRWLENTSIGLDVTLFKRSILRHHEFLNEARLSALAISVYLAAIKVNPSKGKLKLLVLDDLLIGLDMSNRMPLLNILKDNFEPDFQIFMTTYDKIWYELVQNFFGKKKWKYLEVYSKKLKDEDIEIPVIKPNDGLLKTAEKHLDEKDYKASAVYVRTAFERLVKNICEGKNLKVLYKKNQKELASNDFWETILSQTDISEDLVRDIEIYRGVVMNPFSHDDTEKPEFKTELENTIQVVRKLDIEKDSFKKVKPADFNALKSKLKKMQIQYKRMMIRSIMDDLYISKIK
ncbi:AAA family ATPase [Marinoscillum sp.]|uniref:AAA family ATPase n=1 Tax=Marinoscillum sp. TaxID=2024838 RepID=UPI003BAD087E